ncbi:MAG: gamma-glutamyl-phosphate reductase, partial [Chloroflexi bacterium]|nr:gamma-glutamyl-phosphate reductase [Chloroflexota bacterium]
MQSVADELEVKAGAARKASRTLANLTSDIKDRALRSIADGLLADQSEILDANARDIATGNDKGLAESFL